MRGKLVVAILVALWGVMALCSFYHIDVSWARPYLYFYAFLIASIWLTGGGAAIKKKE